MSTFLDDIFSPIDETDQNNNQQNKVTEKKKDEFFSVSQISQLIQKTLTGNFSNIKIKGEVSGAKYGPTGHLYFDLKDDSSVIRTVCWKGVASKLPLKVEDGLEVLVSGNISTFQKSSTYQIVANRIEASGAGALMALLEERKRKLASEGLFSAERKKKLPFMPDSIGVITSPTGSVIRDILHRLEERFGVQVYLYPVQVQGDGAAEQITEAIKFFNSDVAEKNFKVNTIIVARGGGSVEDLWCFNEENVVRATAESRIPIISAVGHETDTTLIDYASDKRAPTPTAAAEIAVPVWNEISSYISDLKNRSDSSIYRFIDNLKRSLELRKRSLISPNQMLMNMAQRVDLASERLDNAISYKIRESENRHQNISEKLKPEILERLLENKFRELNSYKSLLISYDYKNVLNRGFSIIRKDDKIIRSKNDLSKGDGISVELRDGRLSAEILDASDKAKIKGNTGKVNKPKKATKRVSKKGNNNQQDLF